MKKIGILVLVLTLLLFVGCSKEESEESSYDSLVQTFIDVTFGHDTPTKEAVKSLRHRTMWGSDFDKEYNEYVESWTENNAVLKEVFGEDYTYSVKILSSTGDTQEMKRVQDYLNTKVTYDDGYVFAYCTLDLEITFHGNGKTYVAEGEMEVFSSDKWYMTDSLLESVDNFR